MKDVREKGKVNIDITNACVHKCSNCTRFCGHYKTPFFMDVDTFKRAVDSLETFEGIVFIIGGEPTLHPKFEQLIEYAKNKRRPKHEIITGLKPLRHFIAYREQCTSFGTYALNKKSGMNLLTCLPKNYYINYEFIHDSFSHQIPNDHTVPSKHQPILISRKELKIPDDKWIELRDNCWLQNNWSATITPKGAFFCEVAASLDTLFDGPGGWPIEKGWWERTVEEYQDQLHWCEYCSMPVFDLGRYDNEEIDDISPYLYEMLKKSGNKNLKDKKISMISISEDGKAELECTKMYTNETNRYMSSYENRFTLEKSLILPKVVNGILLLEDDIRTFKEPIIKKEYEELFDELFIVAKSNKLKSSVENNASENVTFLVWDDAYGSLGNILNKIISMAKNPDWFILFDKNTEIINDFRNRINKCVINPGVLYDVNGAYMFNPLAKSLKRAGFDGIAKCNDIKEFLLLWNEKKIIHLDENFDKNINPDFKEWIDLSESLSEPERSECLTKLEYIRHLTLLEYYRAYLSHRDCMLYEKISALNECLPQLYIREETLSLRLQLKNALLTILENENFDISDRELKKKLKENNDFFSSIVLEIMNKEEIV